MTVQIITAIPVSITQVIGTTMSVTPLGWVNVVAASVILVHAMCVINRMSWKTNHLVRISYIVLAVGAAAVILAPLYGYLAPQFGEVLINIGAGFTLVIGRWLRHGGFRNEGYSSLLSPFEVENPRLNGDDHE